MKKKRFLFFLCSLLSIYATYGQNTVYVSTQGNDNASGTFQQPLRTVDAALKLIRTFPGNDTVYVKIASGNYFLEKTIEIGINDKRPIVFEGNAKDKPVMNGGFAISNWAVTPEGWWKCRVPEVIRYGVCFEQLFVNGQRAIRARTPDKGWYMLESSVENIVDKGNGYIPFYGTQKLYTRPANLSSLRKVDKGDIHLAVISLYHKWENTRKHIDYANVDSGLICISGEGMKPWNILNNTTRFFLENYKEALNSPGEWFLEANGDLYYIPREGEKINKTICFAPLLRQLLIVRGKPNSVIRSKTFRNIDFDYAAYRMPSEGNLSQQAAVHTDAAIQLDWVENILFDNCEVKHTGNYALCFGRGCRHSVVRHSYFYDLGAGGIRIGEPDLMENKELLTSDIRVENNIINHVGLTFPAAVGVIVFNSGNNKILHNEISDLRYSGISVGWMWGYAIPNPLIPGDSIRSAAVNNEIAYNHVHHIGWGELADMGAIYTLGVSPGTTIHHNVIHDVYSYDYGGWGLYTDEGSSYEMLENNLVYATKSGGFHQHYGENNIIRNNIFAFGLYQQLEEDGWKHYSSFTFTNNIIIMDCGSLLKGKWFGTPLKIDKNCYWNMQGKVPLFVGYSFVEWKKQCDKNAIISDPMFKDPLHGDFTFKSLKTAHKIGFKPFDYLKAGVQGDNSWKKKAQMPQRDIEAFNEVIKENEKVYSLYYK